MKTQAKSPIESRVEACIQAVMAAHSGEQPKALAAYYEAVLQDLAPLARSLEAENAELRRDIERLRLASDLPDPELPLSTKHWIGVDLDRTLAYQGEYVSAEHIGAPIPAMADRVRAWLAQGEDVRIFTARVDGGLVAIAMGHDEKGHQHRDVKRIRRIIQDWTELHFGERLPVTNIKDFGMKELWDDKAFRVVENTGCTCCEQPPKPIDLNIATSNLHPVSLLANQAIKLAMESGLQWDESVAAFGVASKALAVNASVHENRNKEDCAAHALNRFTQGMEQDIDVQASSPHRSRKLQ